MQNNFSEPIRMVDLNKQHSKIRTELDAAYSRVLESSAFINGQQVSRFENQLANYLDSTHVIGCGNGTDALQIALMALDLKPGDEVITTTFTFVATVEVIKLLKLKPVLVEPEPDTFNINPFEIEAAITKRTKAIIPVHLYGQCADMEPILKIAKRYNLWVIEDAAQGIGGSYTFSDGRTQKIGTIGHIACTSFFPSKNLGALGDGGALITNDETIARNIRQISNHGAVVKYHHDIIGVNSRLDAMQAAFLSVKLKHLDSYTEARRAAADYYDKAFEQINNLVIPYRSKNAYHVFHQYTLKIIQPERHNVQAYLKEKGIPTMVYYPIPLHQQKAYANDTAIERSFPEAEYLSRIVLSLPMHTELSSQQLEYITKSLISYVRKH